MVKTVRKAEKAVGKVSYEPTKKQIEGRVFSRSLYVVENIKKGDIITENNVKSIRPGYGLHPMYLSKIIGKKSICDIAKGERFNFDLIEKF